MTRDVNLRSTGTEFHLDRERFGYLIIQSLSWLCQLIISYLTYSGICLKPTSCSRQQINTLCIFNLKGTWGKINDIEASIVPEKLKLVHQHHQVWKYQTSKQIVFQSHTEQGMYNPIYWCTKETWEPSKKYLIIGYEAYMLFLLFFVPLIIMASAYCGVCVELWAVTEDVAPSPRYVNYNYYWNVASFSNDR